jgi:glycosyltransferase involved in cell wall biosynthesis
VSLSEPLDAFAEHRHLRSILRDEAGNGDAKPHVTIAIPTFRRTDTLVEALESALGQATSIPYDIIIVDNEPTSAKWPLLATRLPRGPHPRVRYYVNEENLGMFGNWNRCIELASGPWLTILNDDDLLRGNFISRCFELIERNPAIDGLVPRKSIRDRRAEIPGSAAERRVPAADLLAAKAASLVRRARFLPDGLHRLTVRRLFFGNDLGNGAGFLFRRDVALSLGGYDPRDLPAADFFFLLRMALFHKLYWARDVLAEVGLGDNDSQSREVLLGFITKLQEARNELAGRHVPAAWLRLSPQLVANHLLAAQINWDDSITAREVEERVGFAIPPPSIRRELFDRFVRGAL